MDGWLNGCEFVYCLSQDITSFVTLMSFSTVSTEKRTKYCTLKIEVLFTFTYDLTDL